MDRENSVGGEKSPRSHAAAAWKQMLEDEEAEGVELATC